MKYLKPSVFLGRENVLNESIFVVQIIKTLNFFNVIILTVNDIFNVFILLRGKINEFLEKVT